MDKTVISYQPDQNDSFTKKMLFSLYKKNLYSMKFIQK